MPPDPCVKALKVLKKSTRTAADGSLSILFHTLPPEPGTREKKGTVCATKSLLPVDPKRDPSPAEGFGHCLYTRVSQELPASKKTSSRCYSVRSRQTSWEEFEREEQKRSGPRGIDLLRKIKRAKYVTETRDTTKKGGEEEWDMTTVCKYLKAVNTKEGEELFRVLGGRGRRSNGMDLIRVFTQEPVEGKGEKPPQ